MKKIIALTLLMLSLTPFTASASTFHYQVTGDFNNGSGGNFDLILGTSNAANSAGVVIDNISGTFSGENIIALDSFLGSDNLLFSDIIFDSNGLAFITQNNIQTLIFGGQVQVLGDESPAFRLSNLTLTDITKNVSNVPVPGAIWLFSSGLLALIGFSRRKD